MDYEITHWKIPTDFHRLLTGLDAMVAIFAKKSGDHRLPLYDADYRKVRHIAKQNLPDGATIDSILYRGFKVVNGGTKASKRPVHYTPPPKKIKS